MSALVVIGEAMAQGLILSLDRGRIAWECSRPPPAKLLAKLTEHREEVVNALSPKTAATTLTSEHRGLVEAWLTHIDEPDVTMRQWVLHRCETDVRVLAWVLGQASKAGVTVPPPSKPPPTPGKSAVRYSPLAAVNDLPLLPEDRTFLLNLLAGKLPTARDAFLAGYRRAWMEATANDPLPCRRENSGRRAANLWARQENQGSGKG